MPIPPTVSLTYAVIGGPSLSTAYGSRFTWAALRWAFGIVSETESTIFDIDPSGHWTYYSRGFIAADTSLFRHDPFWFGYTPPATITYVTDPGPPAGRFLFTNGAAYTGVGPFMENEVQAQLTGQAVTMTSGSFNITSDSYTAPPAEQTEGPYLGDYISIGKLLKV
jgi:hypothetical protein